MLLYHPLALHIAIGFGLVLPFTDCTLISLWVNIKIIWLPKVSVVGCTISMDMLSTWTYILLVWNFLAPDVKIKNDQVIPWKVEAKSVGCYIYMLQCPYTLLLAVVYKVISRSGCYTCWVNTFCRHEKYIERSNKATQVATEEIALSPYTTCPLNMPPLM